MKAKIFTGFIESSIDFVLSSQISAEKDKQQLSNHAEAGKVTSSLSFWQEMFCFCDAKFHTITGLSDHFTVAHHTSMQFDLDCALFKLDSAEINATKGQTMPPRAKHCHNQIHCVWVSVQATLFQLHNVAIEKICRMTHQLPRDCPWTHGWTTCSHKSFLPILSPLWDLQQHALSQWERSADKIT